MTIGHYVVRRIQRRRFRQYRGDQGHQEDYQTEDAHGILQPRKNTYMITAKEERERSLPFLSYDDRPCFGFEFEGDVFIARLVSSRPGSVLMTVLVLYLYEYLPYTTVFSWSPSVPLGPVEWFCGDTASYRMRIKDSQTE